MKANIAVLAGPMVPFKADFQVSYEMPYAERPQVEVDVIDDTTLADALNAALAKLNVRTQNGLEEDIGNTTDTLLDHLTFVSFYLPEDDDGYTARRHEYLYDLSIVQPDGRLVWRNNAKDVSFADLRRTHDAGLLNGDPLRPYLVLQPPAGNGIVLALAIVYFGYKVVLDLLSGLPAIRDNVEIVQNLRRRAENGVKALDEHQIELEQNGADPHRLYRLLDSKTWQTDEVAERLGCSVELAAELLDALGYEQSDSGLWRRGESDDAKMIRGLVDEIGLAYETNMTAFSPVFRERAAKYLQDGKRPPPPDFLHLPDDWYEMTPEQQAEWGQRLAGEHGGDEEFAAYGDEVDDDDIGPLLDLEHIDLRCACGESICNARVSFAMAGTRIRMNFENAEDHFVLAPSFFMLLDEAMDEEPPEP